MHGERISSIGGDGDGAGSDTGVCVAAGALQATVAGSGELAGPSGSLGPAGSARYVDGGCGRCGVWTCDGGASFSSTASFRPSSPAPVLA